MVVEVQDTQDRRWVGYSIDSPRRAGAAWSERPRGQRDLRLDLFRGLALIFIFIDHTSSNVISYFTLRSFAFCDAAEVFIFISGMAAAIAYGGVLRRGGPLQATAQIYRRIWQLYVAHIFSFVAYTALVTFALNGANNPAMAASLGESVFLSQPSVAIAELLVLGFQPSFFFILPLYMLLLAVFPPVLLLIRRRPLVAISISAALYLTEHWFGWTLHLYPDHQPWGFSPLAYQFLFVVGAVCGHLASTGRRLLSEKGWIYAVAGAIVAACAAVSFSHSLHSMYESFPVLLPDLPWGSVDGKRDLSLLRLVNFLALAIVAARLVRRDAAFLAGPVARPVVLCGQNSLPIFCIGILLSTVGSFLLDYVSDRLRMQFLVIFAGVVIMIGTALLITWYKRMGRVGASLPAMAATE